MLAPINGVYLHYELTGPEHAPAIALSNALGASLTIWDEVVDALSRDFRILRYDTRGHGGSATARRPITIDDLADDLAELMAFAHIDRGHVAGVSLGGMTALALAARHPGRVASLTALAAAARVPPPTTWSERAATVRASGLSTSVDGTMTRWFTEGFRNTHTARIADIRAGFLSADAEGYALCAEVIGAMDLRDRLSAIAAPTLLIAGTEDAVTPPVMSEALRAAIPGARMAEIAGAAHMIPVEKPAEVADLIRQQVARA